MLLGGGAVDAGGCYCGVWRSPSLVLRPLLLGRGEHGRPRGGIWGAWGGFGGISKSPGGGGERGFQELGDPEGVRKNRVGGGGGCLRSPEGVWEP